MVEWKNAWKKLLWSVGLLPVLICLPVNGDRARGGIMESLRLAKWPAREHVPLCLVLAFFIAGANGVLVLATWGARMIGGSSPVTAGSFGRPSPRLPRTPPPPVRPPA